ncbi:ROK family protein [Cohnella luojiensis]|uniref:ROK family protein n=1 Tax=Cohnella luojiensis TaxID=652876 RepID=A0A4Y8LVR3_9BACL|nr:ROK family protein [Cohnella luojiensis]TFE25225.1 ROK family protein [Cohnella luojiensis]
MNDIYVGIDVGGTKMLAALVNGNGTIMAKVQQPTRAERGTKDTIRRLMAMTESLIKESCSEAEGNTIQGIGIAVAGILDPSKGTVMLATNLGWENVPIGPLFKQYFQCPVQVINDANAAALGEWLAGAGVGMKDVIYVTVSTGIGGGIISDGRLMLGSTNSAAELGHISIDRNGPLCACGNRGCIEVYASGNTIAKRVREDIRSGEASTAIVLEMAGGNPELLNARHVAEAAQAGNEYAKDRLADAGSALGMGLTAIIHLVNPEMIILGGGVSQSGRLLFEPMLDTVRGHGIPEMVNRVRFVTAKLGGDAGAVGAALWWRYERTITSAVQEAVW